MSKKDKLNNSDKFQIDFYSIGLRIETVRFLAQ